MSRGSTPRRKRKSARLEPLGPPPMMAIRAAMASRRVARLACLCAGVGLLCASMTNLAFDEDRDLALAQPNGLVKMAAALSLVGALLGGTASLQLTTVVARIHEPPLWVPCVVYPGLFFAPILAFSAAKLYRLAAWAPIATVLIGGLSTLLGIGQLAFMFRSRYFVCMGLIGPAALCFGTLA